MEDRAISLKEASRILGVSYGSLYRNKDKLAFRLPNTRVWRIWLSTLDKFKPNVHNDGGFLGLGDSEKEKCQSTNQKAQKTGGLISTLEMEKELDALLKQRTKSKRKSTMTI